MIDFDRKCVKKAEFGRKEFEVLVYLLNFFSMHKNLLQLESMCK